MKTTFGMSPPRLWFGTEARFNSRLGKIYGKLMKRLTFRRERVNLKGGRACRPVLFIRRDRAIVVSVAVSFPLFSVVQESSHENDAFLPRPEAAAAAPRRIRSARAPRGSRGARHVQPDVVTVFRFCQQQ